MIWLASLFLSLAGALELQGFVTSDCKKHVGVIIHVENKSVELINLKGQYEILSQDAIETVYVFNVIDNPIESVTVDDRILKRLRAVHTEDSADPRALAFPVRFIEDLIVFYSLDGKAHVYTFADLFKIRPAEAKHKGVHKPVFYRGTTFEFAEQSAKCAGNSGTVKATRVLADKISISEFLHSMEDGFESLVSFEERTYLYAKPMLYDQKTRLGLLFLGKRSEPGLPFPLYFQWSTGEPYRFQAFNVFGSKPNEFLPNAEPVFGFRSDVKSHFFHAHFSGNFVGLPAGERVFVGTIQKLSEDLTAQPSFNYMAMMGGDYGPYSLSVGFYFPTYGIRVRDEYREVLGSRPSYAIRGMYTKAKFRVRAIGALTDYESHSPTEEDVAARTTEDGITFAPSYFRFDSIFIRGGIDYSFSEKMKFGADLISVTGNYKEQVGAQRNDIKFNRATAQVYFRQSFSHYVSLTGYANFLQHTYESNFLNSDKDREQRETTFFGTFEFIF